MRARVVSTAQVPADLAGPVVVVDVLRAFTTAAWVLRGGASALHLAADPGDALRLKDGLGPSAIAVRDGALSDGFELGNSPGQVRRADLRGRPVVQCTTNGTAAVHAVGAAAPVYCASLVNVTATAREVRATSTCPVTYVVTGEGGRAEEDLACVDHLQALVEGDDPPDDTAARVRSSAAAHALRVAVARGYRGVAADDVELACALDTVDVAMLVVRTGRGPELRAVGPGARTRGPVS